MGPLLIAMPVLEPFAQVFRGSMTIGKLGTVILFDGGGNGEMLEMLYLQSFNDVAFPCLWAFYCLHLFWYLSESLRNGNAGEPMRSSVGEDRCQALTIVHRATNLGNEEDAYNNIRIITMDHKMQFLSIFAGSIWQPCLVEEHHCNMNVKAFNGRWGTILVESPSETGVLQANALLALKLDLHSVDPPTILKVSNLW